jgi:hypothetical protein
MRRVFPQQQTSLVPARTDTPQCCCGDCLRQELEDELRGLWANRTESLRQLILAA